MLTPLNSDKKTQIIDYCKERFGLATNIFDDYNASNTKYFLINIGHWNGGASAIRFFFEDAEDRDMQLTVYYTFIPNQWYHVAAIGRFNGNSHEIYINGTLAGSKNYAMVSKPEFSNPIISFLFIFSQFKIFLFSLLISNARFLP